MQNSYEEYVNSGTELLTAILSSPGIVDGEREMIVSKFSEELSNNVGASENLHEYEYLIYCADIGYIDGELTKALNIDGPSYERILNLCDREMQLIQVFSDKGWRLPKLNNRKPDRIKEDVLNRHETMSLSAEIIAVDTRISEMTDAARKDPSIDLCDQILESIDELTRGISLCKQRNIPVPTIKNKDNRKLVKEINTLRLEAEKKGNLYHSIEQIEIELEDIITEPRTNSQQWSRVIELCQEESDLLTECEKRHWPAAFLEQDDLNRIKKRFGHYQLMDQFDKEIITAQATINSEKKFVAFYKMCMKQHDNIEICRQNGWPVPDLMVKNPRGFADAMREDKRKSDKRKKIKRTALLIIICVVLISAAIPFAIHKYREGKVQIPFEETYVQDKDLELIYKELKKAGFTNIRTEEDTSGWLDGEKVISVTIDGADEYNSGKYIKPDVSVIVTYSSPGRVYVTDILQDWRKKKYKYVEKSLQKAGLTNINTQKRFSYDRKENYLTAEVDLNGLKYTSEECYVPKDAPIKVYYFISSIKVGKDSEELKDKHYQNTVTYLKEKGFRDIRLYRMNDLIKGWINEEGTIETITVNGQDEFSKSDTFYTDVPIVIKVHTFKDKGCEDIVDVADE